MKTVSIVTPMYNEAGNIDIFFEKVGALSFPGCNVEIVVVNDGSRDNTLELLKERLPNHGNLKIVNLARNFGQEAAIWAGVENTVGDAIIVMDADMQDPPELLAQMVAKWQEGYDVVNAHRKNRKSDSLMKRKTAKFYYKTLNRLSPKVKYPVNVNNFRLISRRVVEVVAAFPSNEKMFRNAVAQAGFKTASIDFTREKRHAGKSSFNLGSMIRLSFAGIADASVKPLHFAFTWSILFTLLGFGWSAFTVVAYALELPIAFYSWFNYVGLLSAVMFFAGIILLVQSINGYYLGKCYTEIKGRPMYIVEGVYKS